MLSRPAHPDRESSLPALRWVAEEDLIYEPASNTLHRPVCQHIDGREAAITIPAHSSLQLVWAPTMCDCRPDVTLALGGH